MKKQERRADRSCRGRRGFSVLARDRKRVLLLVTARELGRRLAYERSVLAAVMTFAVSWISESLADRYGVQLLTFAILALAVLATNLLRSARRTAEAETSPVAG